MSTPLSTQPLLQPLDLSTHLSIPTLWDDPWGHCPLPHAAFPVVWPCLSHASVCDQHLLGDRFLLLYYSQKLESGQRSTKEPEVLLTPQRSPALLPTLVPSPFLSATETLPQSRRG